MTRKRKQKYEDRPTFGHLIFKSLWLILIAWGLFLPSLLEKNPLNVEKTYSDKIFPPISNVLGAATAITPLSIAEILTILVVLIVVIVIVVRVMQIFFSKIHYTQFLNTLLSIGIFAGVLLNVFYLFWGANYYRQPLAQQLHLSVEKRPIEQLETLCVSLAEEAKTLRAQVDEDEQGVFTLKDGYRVYFDRIPRAYENLGRVHSQFSRRVYPAKGVLCSELMSFSGIAGIYFPFTGEANVNIQQPPLLLLSSAAHETAHYIGVAPEDSANFVAYLACINSDDPAIRYSGVMLALIHCGDKLCDYDSDKYAALCAGYSDGMRRDLVDYDKYWASYEGEVQETVNRINDSYLKHNGQQSGVDSYGEMVDLMLAYYARQF